MKAVGLNAVKRKLAAIRAAIESGEIFEEAAQEWVEEDFKPYAKRIAPVDTGEFRDSIGGEANPQQVRVFAEAEHADVVEFGNSTHKAQPTLGPALKATRRKLGKRVKAAFRKRFT